MYRLIQKFFLYILSLCSLRFLHILSILLFHIFFSKKSKRYKVTRKNLDLCFPDKKEKWKEDLANNSLKEFLKSIIEAPHIWRVASKNKISGSNKSDLSNLIKDVEGSIHITEAIRKNNGIIFITPHHGSWELSGLYAANNIKTSIMYRPLRNKILDNFVKHGRACTGARLVPTDSSGVKNLLKSLQDNNGVGVLPDHTPRLNQGIMSRFFDVPVNTITLINKLSKKKKSPVLFIYSERLKGGKGFKIYIEEIVENFYNADDQEAADILNRCLEDIILRNPEQYLWSYERFRNRVGVKENAYN